MDPQLTDILAKMTQWLTLLTIVAITGVVIYNVGERSRYAFTVSGDGPIFRDP